MIEKRQAAVDRPRMRELVAQHRGQRQRHLPGMAVEYVEQRHVTARDRLEQQLLAERPGPEAGGGVEAVAVTERNEPQAVIGLSIIEYMETWSITPWDPTLAKSLMPLQ